MALARTNRRRRNSFSGWRGGVERLETRDLLAVDAAFLDGLLSLDVKPRDLVIVGAKDGVVTVNDEAILGGSVKCLG